MHTSVGGEPESGLASQLPSQELIPRLLRHLNSDLPSGAGGRHSVSIHRINEGIIPEFSKNIQAGTASAQYILPWIHSPQAIRCGF